MLLGLLCVFGKVIAVILEVPAATSDLLDQTCLQCFDLPLLLFFPLLKLKLFYFFNSDFIRRGNLFNFRFGVSFFFGSPNLDLYFCFFWLLWFCWLLEGVKLTKFVQDNIIFFQV